MNILQSDLTRKRSVNQRLLRLVRFPSRMPSLHAVWRGLSTRGNVKICSRFTLASACYTGTSQHRNKRRDPPHGNGYTMTSIIASNYRRVDRARHASIVSYAWPRSWQRSQNSKRNACIRITFSNEVPRGGGAGGGRKGSRPVQPPPFYENCTARFQLPRAFSRNMLLPSRD